MVSVPRGYEVNVADCHLQLNTRNLSLLMSLFQQNELRVGTERGWEGNALNPLQTIYFSFDFLGNMVNKLY